MVILGLGSNKGDRAGYLRQAVALLAPHVQDIRISSVYETAALMPENAPASWDRPFLNMAVIGKTTLAPLYLLAAVKSIEKTIGRTASEVWAPREIDIDILAMDDLVLDLPQVSIPHRALLDRDFALLPLVELAPDWRFPRAGSEQGKTASDIAIARGYYTNNTHNAGIALYG